jgi:hypothetical protein
MSAWPMPPGLPTGYKPILPVLRFGGVYADSTLHDDAYYPDPLWRLDVYESGGQRIASRTIATSGISAWMQYWPKARPLILTRMRFNGKVD